MLVGYERHVLIHSPKPRVQAPQRTTEGLEVVRVRCVADVEVLRQACRTMRDRGDPADHDEVDGVLG